MNWEMYSWRKCLNYMQCLCLYCPIPSCLTTSSCSTCRTPLHFIHLSIYAGTKYYNLIKKTTDRLVFFSCTKIP
ncbi:hypothetical protein GYMLUDRAFT_779672 [Collybiopsis luxurians FD-317 M1]|uniref:Uncharacterized protein n=1 Tax=Collybiopsis luxurians FD-317 M1 TaxID=944289 RepID=A0A0D0C2T8_9AGAR|nr:hypothetical protein GYMLUDRAFT_779672 [Collybiopsis luxurians FD-317 M1]